MIVKSFNERINKYYNKIIESDKLDIEPEIWVDTEDGIDFVSTLFIMAEDNEVTRYDIGIMLKDFGIFADSTYITYFVTMLRNAGHKIV